MHSLTPVVLAVAASIAPACGDSTRLPDRPHDVLVTITRSSRPYSQSTRLPITFDPAQDCADVRSTIVCFTIDLRVRNLDGSTRVQFTGPNAWLRLGMPAGTIVETKAGAPYEVAGANVRLMNGEAKGVTIKVIAAYGDTRIVAEDVGFVPAPAGKATPECSDGLDNDGNGFADYPNDPGCYFLNDDAERPFDASYGVSPPIAYVYPRILDVHGGAASISPFVSRQVEMQDPAAQMIVTAVTADGMYVTDVSETRRGAHSIFVYNFNAPYGVRVCDRLVRLAGNISDFYGFTEVGTPGWSNQPWVAKSKDDDTCPVPDFVEVTDQFAGIAADMNVLESALIKVKSPEIGKKLGPARAPGGVPAEAASNCDLNGDGIVGFSTNKPGYRDDEALCSTTCSDDPDCTEWNSFRQFSEVKIKFGPGQGVLFLQPTLLHNFDSTRYIGPGKFAELRGQLRKFVGPKPPYILVPRCDDDVIFAGTPPDQVRTSRHACVRPRVGIDTEGTN